MNWEMIGAIGEVGGAVAVVVTLAYLARQVRDSTRQEQRQQMVQLRQRDLQWTTAFADNPDMVEIWLRGLQSLGDLTEKELPRFSFHLYSLFVTNELYLPLSNQGAIDLVQFKGIETSIAPIARSPGVAQWWHLARDAFSDDYQAKVDGWIAAGGPNMLDFYQALGPTKGREESAG